MTDSFIQLGQVSVSTTNNKGHDPEFWAEQVTNKICGISEHAPEHVRQQALAFRDAVYSIVLRGIESGIESDRTTVVGLLRRQGHNDMANIIKKL
jgi:hypothetical protein|tara:strand:+ start:1659 stop:1943 length:285 start_codon:yes stop_codon:yes gene_type:complete